MNAATLLLLALTTPLSTAKDLSSIDFEELVDADEKNDNNVPVYTKEFWGLWNLVMNMNEIVNDQSIKLKEQSFKLKEQSFKLWEQEERYVSIPCNKPINSASFAKTIYVKEVL